MVLFKGKLFKFDRQTKYYHEKEWGMPFGTDIQMKWMTKFYIHSPGINNLQVALK